MYALLILFLILFFGYPYCIKGTFDNNYSYKAISIELISDWISQLVHKPAFDHLSKYKINRVTMNILKKNIYLILGIIILNVSLSKH